MSVSVVDMSLDDLEASFERGREESARWAAEHQALVPSLHFVLRHSGREGDGWRVVFESRDFAEAEDFYYRMLRKSPDPNKRVACTIMTSGGLGYFHRVHSDGISPAKVKLGIEGTVNAALAREEREAMAAKKAARRAAPKVRRRRAAPVWDVPEGVISYEEFRRRHPAEHHADHDSYYTHPMVPKEAFASANGATERAYSIFLAQTRIEPTAAPQRIAVESATPLRIAPIIEEIAAEYEAAAVAQEAHVARARVA